MRKRTRYSWFVALTVLFVLFVNLSIGGSRAVKSQEKPKPKIFDVRKDFGGVDDGKTNDTAAINEAIKVASADGIKNGVTNIVLLPGGVSLTGQGIYRGFSIHLTSSVILQVGDGAELVAADPRDGDGKYDQPEPNQWDLYQDFGHSHWHNSFIWAENSENIGIIGPGHIWGKGLVSQGNQSRTREQNDAVSHIWPPSTPFGYPNPRDTIESGWANKTIALKNCHNVRIGDGLSILHGGHFAILATGVDDLNIDEIFIDTNRDGIDIDSCKRVVVTRSKVNSPNDDAICPKSSYALGYARATENVLIAKNKVSGYDEGTMLDGTFKRDAQNFSPSGPTGRIKLGTESNGGFKHITITENDFEYCRGIAIETVDGGVTEDITITNNRMRDIGNAPIFICLGNRARGPKNSTGVGSVRGVLIDGLTVTNANSRYASIIIGISGYPVEVVTIKDITIQSQGGGTKEQALIEPPEKESDYPEPTMMFHEGTPASGFYIRHAKSVTVESMIFSFLTKDERPTVILNDVGNFSLKNSQPLLDMILDGKTKLKSF